MSTARAFAFEPHVFCTIENSGFSGRVRLLTDGGYEDLLNSGTTSRIPTKETTV